MKMILQDMTKATHDELLAQIALMQAENAKLKAQPQRGLTLKVSKQGAVSVYGMGKWPVTLYQGQWTKLLAMKDEIGAFIEANKASLSVKD